MSNYYGYYYKVGDSEKYTIPKPYKTYDAAAAALRKLKAKGGVRITYVGRVDPGGDTAATRTNLLVAMKRATELAAESGERVYFVVLGESGECQVTPEWPERDRELFRAYPGGRKILSTRGKGMLEEARP